MYQPSHHREDRLEVLHALIRTSPLGALVTLDEEGLVANHIPFILDASVEPLGTLRGHIARANGQWREFIEIDITRMEGKWKVSQNRPAADRHGVAHGLKTDRVEESEENIAMAQLVEEFSPKS